MQIGLSLAHVGCTCKTVCLLFFFFFLSKLCFRLSPFGHPMQVSKGSRDKMQLGLKLQLREVGCTSLSE